MEKATCESQNEGAMQPFRKLATPPLVDHAFIALSFSELSRTIPLILKVSILKKVEFFGPLFFGVF